MTRGSARRAWSLGPLWLTVAFQLVVLRPELSSVQTQNDFGMHLSMVRWATERIGAGHLPLDGWYPYLGLGSPQFSQYPTFAHVVVAVVAQVFDAAASMRWAQYLALATWPIAVYLGARLCELDRRAAVGAAVVAPYLVSVTGYGLELSSYSWNGFGIWPQVFAQWLLPIAWGLSWRAIKGTGRTWVAAAAVGATIALHFVTGYACVAGVAGLMLAASAGDRRVAAARVGRALLVLVGAALSIAYVIVPLLQQRQWASFAGIDRRTVAEPTSAYGPIKALGWLVSGALYDHGRLPVVTLLVLVGLAVCVVRRQAMHRAILGLFGMTFGLFAAGASLGPLRAVLPGSSDLFTRFVMGVHLAGVLAAGVAGAELVRLAHTRLTAVLAPPDEAGAPSSASVAVAIVAIAGVVLVSPAWYDQLETERSEQQQIAEQQRQDATDGAALESLLAKAKAIGPGRVYAGAGATWGKSYEVGRVPVYMWLNNHDVDAVGYGNRVASLSLQVEVNFIDIVPGDYPLFGVRYLLTPSDRPPPAGLAVREVATAGRHTLWEVRATTGYVGVVDTEGLVIADHHTLADRVLSFMATVPPVPTRHPILELAGEAAAPATEPSGQATGVPGTVVRQRDDPAAGHFVATVAADRAAAVVLRTSYSGKWAATVDGQHVRAYPVAPSFVAVTVPRGTHDVAFDYQPYDHYLALWALGIAALVSLGLYDRGSRRLRLAGGDGRRGGSDGGGTAGGT